MTKFHRLPKPIFRLLKSPPQVAYALGLGPIIGRMVLLLTTTGRVTGKLHVTPLQYEKVGEVVMVGATRGLKSDWVRNIQKDSRVQVRIGSHCFKGCADVITDLDKIVEFLELRLRNHPRMVGAMFKAEGIPSPPTKEDLKIYGSQFVLVAIHPEKTRTAESISEIS